MKFCPWTMATCSLHVAKTNYNIPGTKEVAHTVRQTTSSKLMMGAVW